MFRKLIGAFALIAVIYLWPTDARALSLSYAYNGTTFPGGVLAGNTVTGEFIVDCDGLTAGNDCVNLSSVLITPNVTSFSFSVPGVLLLASPTDSQAMTVNTNNLAERVDFSIFIDDISGSFIFLFSGITQQVNCPSCGPISTAEPGTFSAPEVTAAPEPSTLALFATGLALLGFIGWRRRRPVQVKAA